MRLPNFYKSLKPFDGNLPTPSTVNPLIQFYIGEDIDLELPLFLNDSPIDLSKWTMTAILKSHSHAVDILWEGHENVGIYHNAATPSIFRIVIKSTVTADLCPGTYWIDLVLKAKVGAVNDVVDRTMVIARIPCSLDFSAFSTKPQPDVPNSLDITTL